MDRMKISMDPMNTIQKTVLDARELSDINNDLRSDSDEWHRFESGEEDPGQIEAILNEHSTNFCSILTITT